MPLDQTQDRTDADVCRARVAECLERHAGEFHRAFRVYLHRFLNLYGPALDQEAQEIFAGVTVFALEHAEELNPDRNPVAWLKRVGLNLVRRTHEGRDGALREVLADHAAPRQTETNGVDEALETLVVPVPDIAEATSTRVAVRQTLAKLSSENRRILLARYEEEVSYAEIGRREGITETHARVKAYRARAAFCTLWEAGMDIRKEDAR